MRVYLRMDVPEPGMPPMPITRSIRAVSKNIHGM